MSKRIPANIKLFLDKCKRDKINAYSAQSAFFIILSVIPFLMVISSLLQYTSVTEGMLLRSSARSCRSVWHHFCIAGG